MSLRDTDFIIDESNWLERCQIRAEGYGLIQRDYDAHPVGSMRGSVAMEAVADMPLIPMEEWPERIAEKVAKKNQVSDIWRTANNGGPIPSLDQGQSNYCWAHSATGAAIALRAVANMPYVRLSAFAVACIIKNYRNQGGWGALALDFIRERGVPSVEFWPEQSTSRSNDNPQTWENAKLHKVVEGWIDLQAAQYDRNLSIQQQGTCLLSNVPTVDDYNDWSHSVNGHDLVDIDKGLSARDPMRYGKRIKNSWRDTWGDLGWGVRKGRLAWSDGCVAPRVILLSDR